MIALVFAVRLPHYGALNTPPNRQYPPPAEQKNVLSTVPGTCAYDERWQSSRYTHYGQHYYDMDRKECLYQSYYGSCRFLSMEYANDDDNALKIEVQFTPKMRKVRQSDLIKIFKVEGDFPSQKWVEDRYLSPGKEVMCTYSRLRQGGERSCYDETYELHGIDVKPQDDE